MQIYAAVFILPFVAIASHVIIMLLPFGSCPLFLPKGNYDQMRKDHLLMIFWEKLYLKCYASVFNFKLCWKIKKICYIFDKRQTIVPALIWFIFSNKCRVISLHIYHPFRKKNIIYSLYYNSISDNKDWWLLNQPVNATNLSGAKRCSSSRLSCHCRLHDNPHNRCSQLTLDILPLAAASVISCNRISKPDQH